MRPKSIILLTLALGCGLVASIGINQVMANRHAAPVVDTGQTTPIFVAGVEIGIGDPLTPQVLKLEPWPNDKLPSGTLGKLEDVEGRRSRAKFYTGEPILEAKLLPKGESGGSAIDLIPKGMRVVPIRVDAVTGASGMILPGDRVDMLVHLAEQPTKGVPRAITRTFLHNIKIFAVDDLYDRPGSESNTLAAKTISVLVSPEQAELVALACQLGTVQLVMRSAGDDVAENTGGADLQKLLLGRSDLDTNGDAEDFFASLKPKEPAPPPAVTPPEPEPVPEDNVFTMVLIDGNKPREAVFRRGKLITPLTEGSPLPEVQIPAGGTPLPEAEGDGSAQTGEQVHSRPLSRRSQ
ncbi:MAG TPA: Flp pilus assembly protein CpaB [Pirellulales bacterium]|jgi:pilus assembly protein CpaB|nr:Flp pilus assembly protein CpaB [Pirellulales bacterium]